ncbi:putative D,D-dipeptide transport ATP-binding protein DdpF [Marinomonas aquimarina]|uniref:Putative D,D-dipeptide transport ATP-binding protein DdpF n=1 Tax=Marinomonas aquimarina TaxID=295068 RepID=A0A1A8TI82_9GAMM|nr:ATP-binding cassette domain-containing protein [Marinomonas aquimarina]SBS33362.1 putative D,D-dipeptide transport ATP-binding protein DdpF [Marinomonas aquimarina]
MSVISLFNNAQAQIHFHQVSVSYFNKPKWLGGKEYKALDNLSLTFGHTSLAIVGPSGAGKSTLIDLLFGAKKPTLGHVSAFGIKLPLKTKSDKVALCRAMSLVPQEPHTSLNPFYSVRKILSEPLQNMAIEGDHEQVIQQALTDVGLSQHLLDFKPNQLSTGQAQRVAIARALVLEPEILVADEPTSSLDPVSRQRLIDLLNTIKQRRNMKLLLVTHDLTAAQALCDEMLVLNHGKIIEHNTTEQVMNAPSHEVTQALIAAQPCLALKHS